MKSTPYAEVLFVSRDVTHPDGTVSLVDMEGQMVTVGPSDRGYVIEDGALCYLLEHGRAQLVWYVVR